MEQYFRIAIWMFCLVACLQAKPIQKRATVHFDIEDLDFSSLDEISCKENVTFKTPVKVPSQSNAKALTSFTEELERVKTVCTDEGSWAELLAENVKQSTPENLKSANDNSSEMQWENKEFKVFLRKFQMFLEDVNLHMNREE